MGAAGAVIGIERERGQIVGDSGFASELCGENVGHGGQIIGAGSVGVFKCIIYGHTLEGLIWRLVGEVEFLSESKTDDAGDGEFLNRKIVFGLDELLLAGLEFDFGAEAVDFGRSACGDLIRGLFVEGSGGLDLGFGGGDRASSAMACR